jgi:hypothetical protein
LVDECEDDEEEERRLEKDVLGVGASNEAADRSAIIFEEGLLTCEGKEAAISMFSTRSTSNG